MPLQIIKWLMHQLRVHVIYEKRVVHISPNTEKRMKAPAAGRVQLLFRGVWNP